MHSTVTVVTELTTKLMCSLFTWYIYLRIIEICLLKLFKLKSQGARCHHSQLYLQHGKRMALYSGLLSKRRGFFPKSLGMEILGQKQTGYLSPALSYEAADMELTAMEQKSDSDVADDDKVTILPEKRLTTRNRKEIGRVSQTDFNFLAEQCKNRTEALFGTQNTRQTLNVQQENNNWSIEKQSTCMPINENYENVVPQYTIISKNGSRRILMPRQETKQQEHVDNLQKIMSVNQRSPLPSGSKQIKVVPASQIYLLDEKAESVCDSNFPASQMDFEENEEFTYEIEQSNENGQIKLCIDIQNTIVQNQSTLLENQMRIIQQLANQEAMLQLLCQHLSNTTITASTSQTSDKPSDDSTHDPLPIDSLVKLEQLEMALQDETYMKQLIIKKSQICGTNGKMNGLNCCYHLIDCFFKRQFLMQFSWSGGSRRDEGKMPFKMYKNVMKTFYKIVSKADTQFSEKGEIFFKGVIKNAKRRSELEASSIEKRRVSSGKKRPRNLTYKTVKENETQSDDEIDTANAGGDTEGMEENEKAEEIEEAGETD